MKRKHLPRFSPARELIFDRVLDFAPGSDESIMYLNLHRSKRKKPRVRS